MLVERIQAGKGQFEKNQPRVKSFIFIHQIPYEMV